LFLYRSLPPNEIEAALALSREMFAGRLSPAGFLRSLNPGVVSAVARASAEMVSTRREQLLRYAG
jgi:hypothetical protein